jgi:hypothetical protein
VDEDDPEHGPVRAEQPGLPRETQALEHGVQHAESVVQDPLPHEGHHDGRQEYREEEGAPEEPAKADVLVQQHADQDRQQDRREYEIASRFIVYEIAKTPRDFCKNPFALTQS